MNLKTISYLGLGVVAALAIGGVAAFGLTANAPLEAQNSATPVVDQLEPSVNFRGNGLYVDWTNPLLDVNGSNSPVFDVHVLADGGEYSDVGSESMAQMSQTTEANSVFFPMDDLIENRVFANSTDDVEVFITVSDGETGEQAAGYYSGSHGLDGTPGEDGVATATIDAALDFGTTNSSFHLNVSWGDSGSGYLANNVIYSDDPHEYAGYMKVYYRNDDDGVWHTAYDTNDSGNVTIVLTDFNALYDTWTVVARELHNGHFHDDQPNILWEKFYAMTTVNPSGN